MKRKKRKVKQNVGVNAVVDDRKKLTEMSSKAKTSFKIDTRDKKLFVGGSSDKKKRKREDKTEEKNEENSVPKRKKIVTKGDNQRETRRKSPSSSLLDKKKGGDKNKWEPSVTGEGFQGEKSSSKQVHGENIKNIRNFFESLQEHQRGPQLSMAVNCTDSQRPLTNGRELTILDGLVPARPWLEATLEQWEPQPMGEDKTENARGWKQSS